MVQVALPLGPHDPADAMVLDMSLADQNTVWSLWKAPISSSQDFGIWPCHDLQVTSALEKHLLACLPVDFDTDVKFNHNPSSDHAN